MPTLFKGLSLEYMHIMSRTILHYKILCLTNRVKVYYIQLYRNKICKGCDEEEYALPLKRESGCMTVRCALKGCLKEGVWKVASEPEAQSCESNCKSSRVIPVTG